MTTSQRLTSGTLLGGRYRLVEPLPGAGRSWRARDEVDGRDLMARVIDDSSEEAAQVVREKLDDAAQGTVADEHQGQNDLTQPGTSDGQVEQHLFLVAGHGGKGLLQSVEGHVELLVDELAAALVLLCQMTDGLTGQGVQSELAALAGSQTVSRTIRRRDPFAVGGQNRLVAVLGPSYDAHGRDLHRSRVVGTVLDLRDPGVFVPLPRPGLPVCVTLV